MLRRTMLSTALCKVIDADISFCVAHLASLITDELASRAAMPSVGVLR